jgi:tellurite resistance protein TehA-like permease
MRLSAYQMGWQSWIRQLYPGYFACVMATGIISVAFWLSQIAILSLILWAVAGGLFVFLLMVYVIRLLRFPREVRQDLSDPRRLFGYFTIVAALGVLAARAALGRWLLLLPVLTGLALLLWLLLTYWAFAVLFLGNERPIERAIDGSWLITIVATESLAISWALLAETSPSSAPFLQLVAYLFWGGGLLLYLIVITLIVYRLSFRRTAAGDLTSPYWITMGAMAITTVAGAQLLQIPHPLPLLTQLTPFTAGLTLMMWAWGSWWIPLLVIIECWKYGVKRRPIRYEPALWAMVFPLGMYATALYLLAQWPGISFLRGVALGWTWLAFGVWSLVMVGWLLSLGRQLRRAASAPDRPPAALTTEARPAAGQGAQRQT